MRRLLASLRCWLLCDLCRPNVQDTEREIAELRKQLGAKDDLSRYTHRAYVDMKNRREMS